MSPPPQPPPPPLPSQSGTPTTPTTILDNIYSMLQRERNRLLVLLFLLHLSTLVSSFPPGQSSPLPAQGRQARVPSMNCSDCKHHLTNRIRQMQHLQRMKQRIMSAILSNGNQVPVTGGSGERPMLPQRSRGNQSTVESTTRNSPLQPLSGSSLESSTRVGGQVSGVSSHLQHPVTGDATLSPEDRYRQQVEDHGMTATNDTEDSSGPAEGGRGRPPVDGGHENATMMLDKDKKDNAVTIVDNQGPKIVSFSRVVSSGKRKHVLQFSLTPTTPGADLEVVRAHLWLLLTRHHSKEDRSNHEKVKVRKSRSKDRVGGRRKHKRTRRDLSTTKDSRSQNSSDIGLRDPQPDRGDDSEDDVGDDKTNSKQGVEESQGNISVRDDNDTNINDRDEIREGGERKGEDDNKDDDEVKKNDDEREEGKPEADDEDDDRFKAVLRVMLVSDNGTRSLMTYLRTSVRRTHWQKVQLPISVIQQELQSSHATITLLIRCRLCGGTVRMALPRDSRPSTGTARRGRQQERRRRKKRRMRKHEVVQNDGENVGEVKKERSRPQHQEKEEEEENHSRKGMKREKKKRRSRRRRRRRRKNRRRRHGVRNPGDSVSGGRRKWRREEKEEEAQQNRDNFRRPLPFLVINTRLRAKATGSS